MEKIILLEEKIRKILNLFHELKRENRHLREELNLREEESRKARHILKESENLKKKIQTMKERMNRLLARFAKYQI